MDITLFHSFVPLTDELQADGCPWEQALNQPERHHIPMPQICTPQHMKISVPICHISVCSITRSTSPLRQAQRGMCTRELHSTNKLSRHVTSFALPHCSVLSIHYFLPKLIGCSVGEPFLSLLIRGLFDFSLLVILFLAFRDVCNTVTATPSRRRNSLVRRVSS